MADTSQDLLLLLKTIETAKSILEPSKMDELRLTYKLEGEHELNKENLRIAREDKQTLQKKREDIYETLSDIEKTKFGDYISPNTGNLSNMYGKKLLSIDDAITKYDNQIDLLQGEITRMEDIKGSVAEGAFALTNYFKDPDFVGSSAGVLPLFFEQADYNLAVKDYLEKLPKGLSDEQRDMREHGFRTAYQAFTIDNPVTAEYQKKIDGFDAYMQTVWMNKVDPQYASKGAPTALQLTPSPGAPLLAEQALQSMKDRISAMANEMYQSKEWKEDEAPIKIDKNGVASFSEDKFEEMINRGFGSEEEFKERYAIALQDFTSNMTTETAFANALQNVKGTGLLLAEIAPGLTIGDISLGDNFSEMRRFFTHPAVAKFLNKKLLNQSTYKGFLKSFLKRKSKS